MNVSDITYWLNLNHMYILDECETNKPQLDECETNKPQLDECDIKNQLLDDWVHKM